MGNRQAGAVQATDAGHLLSCVGDLLGVDRLLRLEDAINALSGNHLLPLKIKDEGRILSIEDDYVDLFAEPAITVDNMRRSRLIALGQIGLEQL